VALKPAVRASFLCLALVAAAAGAEPADQPLAPYAALAGGCFRGAFPNGKDRDEHCWSWIYGGKHLRDVHVVTHGDGKPAYRGEAVYTWDGKQRRIVYRYWNSHGGYSDGWIEARDGALYSPEERYSGPDGKPRVIRSSLRVLGPDGYVARSESLRDGRWVEDWTVKFTRVGAASGDTAAH
jgi:hypothetical protein